MGSVKAVSAIIVLLWLMTHFAVAQNEIAWQMDGTRGRLIDSMESVFITEGYALVGVNETTVGVYEAKTGALIRDIALPNPVPVERRSFAADNGRLVVSDTIWAPNPIRGQSRAYSFDIRSGRLLAEFKLPTPSLRLGMGGSVATDGQIGLLTSLGCLDTCLDPDPIVKGIVDAFDVATGKHLFQVVSPDNAVFGQGLDVDGDAIAISARSRSLAEPGRVLVVDSETGELKKTITPEANLGQPGLRHNFGFDLALEGDRLVVGDNPDLSGHGLLGDGKGIVSIYDTQSGNQIAEFRASDVGLEGTPQFGHSIDVFDGKIIVGAPGTAKTFRSLPLRNSRWNRELVWNRSPLAAHVFLDWGLLAKKKILPRAQCC